MDITCNFVVVVVVWSANILALTCARVVVGYFLTLLNNGVMMLDL